LTCRNFQIFSVSLAKDGGGAATPLDAASDAATTGGFGWDLPADGWVVIGSPDTNASEVGLRSGDVELHAFRARDGTWLIDSGKRCS
jgi:hypothetical protein